MNNNINSFSRRTFLTSSTLLISGLFINWHFGYAHIRNEATDRLALALPHFPSPLHAFIWRNWYLVPLERIAKLVKAEPKDILLIGKSMGLSKPEPIPSEQQLRSYLTIIRCNWHLLPREQLVELLGWTDEKLTFTLQEDDFFYIKLGSLKPVCEPIFYTAQTAAIIERSKWLKSVIREEFPNGIPAQKQPLFHFVKELSKPPTPNKNLSSSNASGFSPRFGYAYFALFGDPLLDTGIDPYPDAYLARMAASGMDSTWLHIVLSKLTPFPWDPSLSTDYQERLKNLEKLVFRTKNKGIGIYLYLNEPRFLPLSFFEKYPDLKGVTIGDQASLCTSHPDVQRYLLDSLALITETVPDLAGFFSITASENHTNCWSHGKGNDCPRCGKRGPAAVISELNSLYFQGIQKGIQNYKLKSKNKYSGKVPQLIAWDWGWKDGWAEQIIPELPKQTALMSVSEWDLEIERGGIKSQVGEYSISSIGPGPRAIRHWGIARKHGLKTIAKIQAGNTWEIAAVPYIPALENVATHAANLRKVKVDGMMLGWTLGGYPSPNLEVVSAIGSDPDLSIVQAMKNVAHNRYGDAADAVVRAWQKYSAAFSEFPYGSGLYMAPMQAGSSNLLWEKPTGYSATMVGIPYDDVKRWTGNYPVEIFVSQMNKIADGFDIGLAELLEEIKSLKISPEQRKALRDECNISETISIHCRSAANQALFTTLRDHLSKGVNKEEQSASLDKLQQILNSEITIAKRMNILQNIDSRLGFEASNHYFYIPIDLVEKIVSCRDLLDRWLPELKKHLHN